MVSGIPAAGAAAATAAAAALASFRCTYTRNHGVWLELCCAAEETERECTNGPSPCSKGPPRGRQEGGPHQHPEIACKASRLPLNKQQQHQQQEEDLFFVFSSAAEVVGVLLQAVRRPEKQRAVKVSSAVVLLPPRAAAPTATAAEAAAAGGAAASSTAAPWPASVASPRSEPSLHSAAESPRVLEGGPPAPQGAPQEASCPPIPSSSSSSSSGNSSSNSSSSSVGVFGWIARKLWGPWRP
ncbi:hypothetical protein ACSSS7_003574 [Eimeria intestinalis]